VTLAAPSTKTMHAFIAHRFLRLKVPLLTTYFASSRKIPYIHDNFFYIFIEMEKLVWCLDMKNSIIVKVIRD